MIEHPVMLGPVSNHDDPHVLKSKDQTARTVGLEEQVFGRKVRTDLLARLVHYQRSRRRSGSASTKGRSEIRGGGRKPFRQKGTGHARQGTIRAPQMRGGGVVFGPRPRSYDVKMSKRERRLALQIALSAKFEAGELILIDQFGLTEIKTKAMRSVLENLGALPSVMIVLPEIDKDDPDAYRTVELSARNLPRVSVIRVEGINAYDLLAHEKLVLTEAALQQLQERLA